MKTPHKNAYYSSKMITQFFRSLPVQEAAELLFELGSEDRLRILTELGRSQMRLSQLAETLKSTIQEVSRQTGRLERAELIEKHPDGRFGLTPFGRTSLSLLPAFILLQKEREYFKTHDASALPLSFVERLGELLEHKSIVHIDDALKFQQRVVKESEQYVWFMSDQPVGHSLRPDHAHFSSQTSLRIILPKSADTTMFQNARKTMGARFEVGLVDEVKIVIAMNEKIAALGLPTLDKRIDYSRGFVGDSPSFHAWCSDLFSQYWSRTDLGIRL
jgi:predicted transcriptional regulator